MGKSSALVLSVTTDQSPGRVQGSVQSPTCDSGRRGRFIPGRRAEGMRRLGSDYEHIRRQ
jgi:hypothetical protein